MVVYSVPCFLSVTTAIEFVELVKLKALYGANIINSLLRKSDFFQ